MEYDYQKGTLELIVRRGEADNANKIIVFDWAAESDRLQGGYDEAAGDALFAMLVENDLLDSDYLHLIGHSRGTIVSSEAAQRILHYGYPVNQLTLLDTEPGPSPYNKAGGAYAWEGIDFVDNYYGDGTWWQLSLLQGEAKSGAYNLHLSLDHSGVHEWYTNTIKDLSSTGSTTDGYKWRVNDPKPIPPDPPTGLTLPPDVVNGDFEFGLVTLAPTAEVIAGWNYHGGSGTGHVDLLDPGDYDLELDFGDDWKMHNWLFAPENAVQLLFDAKVEYASSNDVFKVHLEPCCGGKPTLIYQPLSLDRTTGWLSYAVDISESAGSVFRFMFNIDAPGLLNIIDSQVHIDNVRFVHIPIVPEPATLVMLMLAAAGWSLRRGRVA